MSQGQKQANDAKYPQKGNLLAKVFVICCRCRFWHDLPPDVYAKLAGLNMDRRVSVDSHLASRTQRGPPASQHWIPSPGHSDKIACCWCGHRLDKVCCEGWSTEVNMCERHH
ncbi:hypothetical protein ASPZODRAFT_129986 [Penicilliopsis zonata CBS 506.65]|uniref:Uncharacterized protein n=1 Tax=Penicilliopsis zonata CBS 506.65 TaxID=1073090 RepID=A0A1L9SLK3_9EURO|nr:hypothetical protein ASPZODRAFT_129986 [Penicilliopsis zonata CBS 506.65]OJJ48068.1 hypothetical protein ASPZODRAFT_129986 [Penicilliopsis zonata CBS 506.65]